MFISVNQFNFNEEKKLKRHLPSSLSGNLSLKRHAVFTYSLKTSGLSAKI